MLGQYIAKVNNENRIGLPPPPYWWRQLLVLLVGLATAVAVTTFVGGVVKSAVKPMLGEPERTP